MVLFAHIQVNPPCGDFPAAGSVQQFDRRHRQVSQRSCLKCRAQGAGLGSLQVSLAAWCVRCFPTQSLHLWRVATPEARTGPLVLLNMSSHRASPKCRMGDVQERCPRRPAPATGAGAEHPTRRRAVVMWIETKV